MAEPAKRKKGAPKGNRNAVKHGFYSRVYDEAERIDFNVAAGIQGIDAEIALLRMEIKKAVSGGDTACASARPSDVESAVVAGSCIDSLSSTARRGVGVGAGCSHQNATPPKTTSNRMAEAS